MFVLKGDAGIEALDRWIGWARRCRIPVFVACNAASSPTIPRWKPLREDLSNALVGSTNTKIRLLTRIAFGFRTAEPLSSLAIFPRRLPPQPGRPYGMTAQGCVRQKSPKSLG